MGSPLYVDDQDVNEELDVLYGRGVTGIDRKLGNARFRAWVELVRDDYKKANKNDKFKICARIAAMVLISGGRFLNWVDKNYKKKNKNDYERDADRNNNNGVVANNYDDGRTHSQSHQSYLPTRLWLQMEDSKVMEKTSETLREIKVKPLDSELEVYEQSFFHFWNSKNVLKRAQALLECRQYTANFSIELRQTLPHLERRLFHLQQRQEKTKKRRLSRDEALETGEKNPEKVEEEDDSHHYSEDGSDSLPLSQAFIGVQRKRRSHRKRHRNSRRFHEQSHADSTVFFNTTVENRRIQAITLALDDSFTNSSDEDEGEEKELNDDYEEGDIHVSRKKFMNKPHFVPPRSAVRRTMIRLDRKAFFDPLYDESRYTMGGPCQEDDSLKLYQASHDLDELVALGMLPMPAAAASRPLSMSANLKKAPITTDSFVEQAYEQQKRQRR